MSEDTVTQRFWGVSVGANAEYTVTLERTELHMTQVSLTGEGAATVSVSTQTIKTPVPLCVLDSKAGRTHTLLDVNFFPEDISFTLYVKGTAGVAVAGAVTIFGAPLEVEEEGEEEAGEGKAAPAPAPAPEKKLSGLEKLKLKRKREEDPSEEAAAAQPPAKVAKLESAAAAPAPAPAPAPKKDSASAEMKDLAGGKVKYLDKKVGAGPKPSQGKKVTVAYVGRLVDGKVFDKSDNFSFRLGVGEVIKGWDVGVASMAVGGTRTLIIHSDYAYGKQGSPPVIPPRATLIFDVTLIRA